MSAVAHLPNVFLNEALAPLQPFLARGDVTDIHVNAPAELWLEVTSGATERHAAPALTCKLLDRLVTQVAAAAHQGINREHPLLSVTLADGARLQAIIPPATRDHVAISIRKHQALDLRVSDYVDAAATDSDDDNVDARLRALLAQSNYADLLGLAVRTRRNILVSGGTSTGKTTFMKALLREIDPAERLIVIEDTPELQIPQANHVSLIAARSALGEAAVTANDLVGAALRMRPDRIILGELRGPEAFAFLRAVNSGHPGSMTTVHADSPAHAIEQIALLVLQAGTTLARADIAHYIRSTIDVYVQLTREGGRRRLSSIVLRERDAMGLVM